MHVIYPLAALAFLIQLMLLVRLHLRGGYNLVSHAVSNYGVGSTKGQFAIYGTVGIVAATLVAIAVLADERLAARAGFYLLTMAALRLGVLAFPTDLEGQRVTSTGKLHYLFAVASFALAYMGIDALYPAAIATVHYWARPLLIENQRVCDRLARYRGRDF
jgi:hypothetical protein